MTLKNKHPLANLVNPKLAGVLIFFILLHAGFQLKAQSFFYFQNQLSNSSQPELTYHTLLMTDPDGSATARIRYREPSTNDDRLIELKLVDSSINNSLPKDSIKYLMSYGETVQIMGNSDSGFLKPRFLFKKTEDSSGAYYVPYAAQIQLKDSSWVTFNLLVNQQKSTDELREMKQFLSIFYYEDEPVYTMLVKEKTRGLLDVRKEKLFLIVVANTNDPSIGITSKKDLDKVTQKFTAIATEMGIQQIVTTKIYGNNFSKKSVEYALGSKLRPGPDDIVIFYYSGHGFRYAEDRSQYPRMSFRTTLNPSRIGNNLSVEYVYNLLLRKEAKVTIVLSDCCNEDIGAAPKVGRNLLKTKGSAFGLFNIDNAKKLFFPATRLSIIAGAADINQLATGNPSLGGFFTNFFITELEKRLYTYSSVSPSWLNIFITAKEKARYQALSALCGSTRCVQTTVFKVFPPF